MVPGLIFEQRGYPSGFTGYINMIERGQLNAQP